MAVVSRLFCGLGVGVLAAALASCAAPLARKPRLEVVTTVLPVTLFTRAVAGDCAQVTALIPPQSGLHDVQVKPADLAALQRASVLVKNGLGLEGFLGKVIAAAGNPSLQVIDSSKGIATIAADSSSAHDHDHVPGPEHSHGADHSHGASSSAVNPHIWLDPRRAIEQVATIRDGLIAADPRCAAGYRQRAAAYSGQLQQLDQRMEQALRPYQGKTVVAYHDVAPYMAERYGIKVAYLVTVPEQQPSPQDMLRLAQIARRNNLKTLLAEPQQSQASIAALARDLGLTVSVFDPLERADFEQSLEPQTYIKVMQANLNGLLKAFDG